ncbi:hypothetical protein GEMRC1_011912 [Eukaryota sp. GEM-RC1]
MSPSEPSLKRSRSLKEHVSDKRNGSSCSISSSNPISDPASALYSPFDSPSSHLSFQQSLLVLIHLHFLSHLLKSSLEWDCGEPRRALLNLKKHLPTFFNKVGYVSHHFFESALLSTKVYFQTNTFHIASSDLPQLRSFASFFGADVQSVFFHVNRTFRVEEFLRYSPVVSGLELELENENDLEFLNKSSFFFPLLKELHVCLRHRSTISLPLIELLKANDTVTSIDLRNKSVRDEGARALADVLKVNSRVTSIDCRDNSVGDEGARALAEALKVNTAVKCIDLGSNSIGRQGARALAEALKVNPTVTSIDVWNNYIGDEGVTALAEALKVNTAVTCINLGSNSIGDEGARALAEALKLSTAVTIIDLWNNSIGDEGARALAEALKVNTTFTSVDLSDNSIGHEGARALADALKVSTAILCIDLGSNSIGSKGARALAEALKVNRTIKVEGVRQLKRYL